MPAFYPGCLVSFRALFDDATGFFPPGSPGTPPPPEPSVPPQAEDEGDDGDAVDVVGLTEEQFTSALPAAGQVYAHEMWVAATVNGIPPFVLAGVVSRESEFGSALAPPGASGVGDFANIWVTDRTLRDRYSFAAADGLLTGDTIAPGEFVPDEARRFIRTDELGKSRSPQTYHELQPPLVAPSTVRAWGYGLARIRYVDERDFVLSGAWSDPQSNANKAALRLSTALRAVQGDFLVALATYNAGPAAVLVALNTGADPDSVTTGGNYGRDVLRRAAVYVARATGAPRAELVAAREEAEAAAVRPLDRPLFTAGQRDALSRVFNKVPKQAHVEHAPYRQAGRFSLTFAYKDFPIDPRLIRACAVEIHMDAIPAGDFAEGMTGKSNSRAPPFNAPRSVVDPTPENLVFVGYVDEWSAEHGENGSWITVQGRDLRALFLDSPADLSQFEDLDVQKPLDNVIRQILDKHPHGARFEVKVNPAEWLDADGKPLAELPSPHTKDGVTRLWFKGEELGAAGAAGAADDKLAKQNVKAQADSNRLNFWDLITQYSFLCGAVPYIYGQEIRLRPSHRLYETIKKTGFDPRFPVPFKDGLPRSVSVGGQGAVQEFKLRRMVYGANVKSLKLNRKFNGYRPRVVEAVSLDTSGDKKGEARVLRAWWPEDVPVNQVVSVTDAKGKSRLKTIGKVIKSQNAHHKASHKAVNVSPSGFRSEHQIIRFPVDGITDENQLRRIAQGVYNEIGRGEFSGTCETMDLASFGGDNGDPDLLRLRPGDPVEFLASAAREGANLPVVVEPARGAVEGFDEQVERVAVELAGANPTEGDRNLARLIVASTRRLLNLQSFFRVSSVRYDFGDTGMKISFDFQNYLEVRFGDQATQGLEYGASAGRADPNNRVRREVVSGRPVDAARVLRDVGGRVP